MYPHHLIWLVSYPYIAPSLTLIHLITLHWNYQKKKKNPVFTESETLTENASTPKARKLKTRVG